MRNIVSKLLLLGMGILAAFFIVSVIHAFPDAHSTMNLMSAGVNPISLMDIKSVDPVSPGMAMALVYADLDFDTEANNMGGFTNVAYLGISTHISAWPAPPTTITSMGDQALMTGDFTMVSGKKFIKIYVSPGTFGLDSEPQGETDGKSFRVKGELFFPGTKKECLGLVAALKNARGTIIAIDSNSGDQIMVGTKDNPLYFSPKVSFGKVAADRRGATIAFECDSNVPAYIFDGVIPLTAVGG